MARTVFMSGFEVRLADLPADAQVLKPAPAKGGISDLRSAITRAIEEPVEGDALPKLLKPGSRVGIVIDDPSLPVPPMSNDVRRDLLESVLSVLGSRGLNSRRVSVVVASGLSRQWRPKELTDIFGIRSTGSYPMQSHDAEAVADMVRLGEGPEGPVEINRAAADVDVVIHLNVVSMPLYAGTFGLVSGTVSYRTARTLVTPKLLAEDPNPLMPGSTYAQAHDRIAAMLQKRVPIFQLSVVLNNELFPPGISEVLHTDAMLSRPLQMWNALPAAVRQRTARLLRASYRPIAVFGGPPKAVTAKALAAFEAQHAVTAQGEADVLLFGLPDMGPGSVGTSQNPILAANLALGYVANLYVNKPLLRPGGVVVFANPLAPTFDRAHLPHQEFYDKVLRISREPEIIHERFESYFAGRPEFVSNYERRFAFHGAHPLFAWYQTTSMRKRAGKIIVPHGDPRACARLGFTNANDIEDGLEKAREFLGIDKAKLTVLEIPPPIWGNVA